MKQKKWKDCPVCGLKGSVKLKEGFYKKFKLKNYPSVKIGPLDKYVCQKCHEGIYTIRTSNLIESQLTNYRISH